MKDSITNILHDCMVYGAKSRSGCTKSKDAFNGTITLRITTFEGKKQRVLSNERVLYSEAIEFLNNIMKEAEQRFHYDVRNNVWNGKELAVRQIFAMDYKTLKTVAKYEILR